MDATYLFGELLTIGTMTFAFSMDAFTLGLGLGVIHLTVRRMVAMAKVTGFLHMLMPLLGLFIGKLLSERFGHVALMIGATILVLIGLSMIHSSLRFKKKNRLLLPFGSGFFLLPLTVSLDSFSAGISLGMLGARVIVTLCLFGIISALLTMLGLLLGRRFHRLFGAYSMAFGGTILVAIGVNMFTP